MPTGTPSVAVWIINKDSAKLLSPYCYLVLAAEILKLQDFDVIACNSDVQGTRLVEVARISSVSNKI
jgi:hypothetical protein